MSEGLRDVAHKQASSKSLKFILRICKDPMGLIGFTIVTCFVIIAILADFIAPFDPNKIDILNKLQGPSANHFFGTDQLGRDTLSRLIHGTQIALLVAGISIGLAVLIGSILGTIAGYGPNWLDFSIMLLFDMVRSYPVIMFALAVVVLFGPSLTTVMAIIVATSFPTYGRLMRTQTQSLRQAEYILSAQALGVSTHKILLRHILPNTIGPILIVASMDVPFVIALEAGLSFLGLGAQPPTPEWGAMLNEAQQYIINAPHMSLFPGLAIFLTVLAFNLCGDGLRDIFDPKSSR